MVHLRLMLVAVVCMAFGVMALPQQNDPDITSLVNDVFQIGQKQQQQQTQQQQQQPTARPLSGFAQIVTPEPVAVETVTGSIRGGQQCNCVPYHMCDPTTNSATSNGDNGGGAETDDYTLLIDIRFNSETAPACEHFLDVCCDGGNTRQESIMPTPQEEKPTRAKGCGVRNVGGIDFNITGALDNEAGFGEFPWTVALLNSGNSSYFCAGSLIHPRVVLTGVHCVIGRPLNSFKIRAGEWDTQTTKERLPYEERSPAKVVQHPRYNPRNVGNDFALIFLQTPFVLGDHINVVCLPPPNFVPQSGTTCYSTGWGKDQFGAQGRFSAIMKRLPLPIVEFNRCQSQFRSTRLGPKFILDPSFICAGGQVGIDTCQGDGGAPLVCPTGPSSENRYHQNGIVVWGIGCNDPIPAAYAHVSVARNWIDEQMYANGLDTTSYTAF
ncbi:phenoloxidase-activating factor 2-like [Musca autumnalis]|uniref:phenoloxidase-activating factor 2-like n=1 Tax=Musca autumnalis TaxID=221902 RepID=UPI003CF9CC72